MGKFPSQFAKLRDYMYVRAGKHFPYQPYAWTAEPAFLAVRGNGKFSRIGLTTNPRVGMKGNTDEQEQG